MKRWITLLQIIVFIFVSSFLGFSQQIVEPYLTPIVKSLLSDDHTSEGFLVTVSGNEIIHFFRLDPGFEGAHAGNSGGIAKRTTYDRGVTWTDPENIFNDEYDDRNIAGVRLENGRIIITFRRYDAVNATHIDFNLIYSDDGGVTWSEPILIDDLEPQTYIFSFAKNGDDGYLIGTYGRYYFDLRYSKECMDFDSIIKQWDFRLTQEMYAGEPSWVYIGDGKILGLVRVNFLTNHQIVSDDYGVTWTTITPTNIAEGYYCTAPLLLYDEPSGDMWNVATDRRGGNGTAAYNDLNSIWICKQKPEDVIIDPLNYQLFESHLRPFPNYYGFYGYPTYTKIKEGHYLVVFTENFKKANGKEHAFFYQFEVIYETATKVYPLVSDNTDKDLLQNYPNPCKNVTTINYMVTSNREPVSIFFYDVGGKLVDTYTNLTPIAGMNSFEYKLSHLKSGIYSYKLVGNQYTVTRKLVISG